MNVELLTALVAFAFVSSITPGPNNLMLMSSGANFGVWRTLPHMLGVGFGFAFMLILVGTGLIKIFEQYPLSYDLLKITSLIYLIYLSVKIALSAPQMSKTKSRRTPISFFQAALFQWINPKAWTMALTTFTVYAPNQNLQSILIVSAVFGIVNLPSVGVWAVLGQQLRRLLNSHTRLKAFNLTMAALLLGSLYPSFL